jgi:hypothetical protein
MPVINNLISRLFAASYPTVTAVYVYDIWDHSWLTYWGNFMKEADWVHPYFNEVCD